ncbi:phage major head subunit gpT-like protein [Rhodobium orientis]|uniref:Bacteriophage Mu GpT domain-containing protein n=1 Tax=Rhodobium orientis TaxID=34017 RepID=A0A327JKK1_9HYPH|nr:Mu-like prophage major head subunit gpT family protein [Rhodobium orientis]MBB4302346.1 phage major head subunit gpT-like protein [Rhodobium orientis]MBK5949051.1 hypothetical protein [Rhodobium orientis]RAI26621.1 hypothetical protein CH339_13555 [Rhodobium orientis]
MLINAANLQSLYVGFRRNFQGAFDAAQTAYGRIATEIPSTTRQNEYGWLGNFPNMREWIGPRHVQSIKDHGYAIKNKPFEITVGVDRDDIEDDNIGIYKPMMEELGRSTAAHPDQLVFSLVKSAFETKCYDGQNFFDTDHKVLDEDGKETSVSNMTAGAGPAWYLLDTSRPLKPFIFQKRRAPEFVAKTDPKTSDRVFEQKEFIYGVDYRGNVGLGFWQMAHGSKADLSTANFDAAYDAMTTLKTDHGRPLGIKPTLLVIPPSLRTAADEVIKNAKRTDFTDNTNKDIVEVFICPWLA